MRGTAPFALHPLREPGRSSTEGSRSQTWETPRRRGPPPWTKLPIPGDASRRVNVRGMSEPTWRVWDQVSEMIALSFRFDDRVGCTISKSEWVTELSTKPERIPLLCNVERCRTQNYHKGEIGERWFSFLIDLDLITCSTRCPVCIRRKI